jgi:hypothetical protein
MGVVIETCIKYPGGPTRMTGTDMLAPVPGAVQCGTARARNVILC